MTIQSILGLCAASVVVAAAGYCAYTYWRGRKVTQLAEADNPAFWYLRDPNKFRKNV